MDDKKLFSDPFKGYTEAISKVTYSQDGIRIVSESINGTVIIKRVKNGSLLVNLSNGIWVKFDRFLYLLMIPALYWARKVGQFKFGIE